VPGAGDRARGPIRRMTVVHALDLLRRVLLGAGIEAAVGRARQDREEMG
jgi:nicotinamide-nucleotide amidase